MSETNMRRTNYTYPLTLTLRICKMNRYKLGRVRCRRERKYVCDMLWAEAGGFAFREALHRTRENRT